MFKLRPTGLGQPDDFEVPEEGPEAIRPDHVDQRPAVRPAMILVALSRTRATGTDP